MSQKVKLFRQRDRQYFLKNLRRKFSQSKLLGDKYVEDHLPLNSWPWNAINSPKELFVGNSH